MKAEWKRVSRATGSASAHKKTKELDLLARSLLDNEKVFALSDGKINNKSFLIAVTSERLVLIRATILSGIQEIDIDLSNILGIDIKDGLMFAEIIVKTHDERIQIKDLLKESARFIAKKARKGKQFNKNLGGIFQVTDNSKEPYKTKVESHEEEGWTSRFLSLVLLGLIIYGIWSWAFDDSDSSVSTSSSKKESEYALNSAEEERQSTQAGEAIASGENHVIKLTGDNRIFIAEFEHYIEDASGGGNLHVRNNSDVKYTDCSIELGDGGTSNRWFLPEKTEIDANGSRSYPTFIFQDKQGTSPPISGSVKVGIIRCANPAVYQDLHFSSSSGTDATDNEVSVIDSATKDAGSAELEAAGKSEAETSEAARAAKQEQAKAEAEAKKVAYVEQLEREIASIPGIRASEYTSDADSIGTGLLLIGAWAYLYEQGGQLNLNKEQRRTRQQFRKLVAKKQVELFPVMRDAYGPIMRQELRKAGNSVRTIGAGYRTVEFVSVAFALEENIKEFHLNLFEHLMMMRFNRVEYYWNKHSGEYKYYKLDPPKDSHMVKWDRWGKFKIIN